MTWGFMMLRSNEPSARLWGCLAGDKVRLRNSTDNRVFTVGKRVGQYHNLMFKDKVALICAGSDQVIVMEKVASMLDNLELVE